MFAHSWLLYPLVLALLSLGSGLLLLRVAGPELPRVLVLPAGFALVVVVSVLLTWAGATAPLAAPAVGVVALVGFAAGWRPLRDAVADWRTGLWPAVAALLPGGTIAAPIVLTGHAGFTGYSRIVDIAFQFEIAEWFQHHGRAVPAHAGDSSYTDLIAKTLGIGYPGGSQTTLGATAHAAGLDIAWAYQPFLAWTAAMLGLAIFFLLRNAIPRPSLRAVAAGVAAQPSILYGYALAAGIKELTTASLLMTTVAILVAIAPGRARARALVPAAIAVAAVFATFNLGVLPWLGIVVLVLLVADLARPESRARAGARWAGLGLATLLVAAPTVAAAFKLASVVAGGGPGDLGNLAVPVPGWSVFGVWMTSDYRFPIATGGHASLNTAGIALVVALVVLGVAWSVTRRDWGLVALALAGPIALAYITRKSGPWVDLKAYTVTAPIALTMAFAGAGLLGRRRGYLGVLAGGLVALAVLYGNALSYHGNNIAPTQRLAELQSIGKRWAGKGPALQPSFEEYADYFLRDVRSAGLVNPPNFNLPLRKGLPPNAYVRDLDDFQPAFVQTFPLLVLRRDPLASRPPSNYRLVQRTTYYDVWRQTGPGTAIRRHLALDRFTPATASTCASLVRSVRNAGAGARVAYVEDPVVARFLGASTAASFGWAGAGAGTFIAHSPGHVRGAVDIPATGRYALWMEASVGRRIVVTVDGRPVGSLRWKESYPGQDEPLATLTLTKGVHRVAVLRGGGSPLPGTGNDIGTAITTSLIGPISFARVGPDPAVQIAPGRRAAALCRSRPPHLDWIEVLAPGAT
jgi:hypothetical protein